MERIENISETVKFPELVFGIVGAVGIDIDEVERAIATTLATVGYQTIPIRITKEIEGEPTNEPRMNHEDLESEITEKMNHANAVCRKFRSADTLMRFAIRAIKRERASRSALKDKTDGDCEERVQAQTAYVIRQLKRPQEVEILRRVYGKQFILISAYGSISDRKRILETALKRSLPLNVSDVDIGSKADNLMHRDQIEEDNKFGQNLRDTFHRADIFIDGVSKSSMESMIKRFVDGLFGKADVAPTKIEYGMYAAKSASLRSSDLSRQIGAAIFSSEGEIITQRM
jgi:hypothetical protein